MTIMLSVLLGVISLYTPHIRSSTLLSVLLSTLLSMFPYYMIVLLSILLSIILPYPVKGRVPILFNQAYFLPILISRSEHIFEVQPIIPPYSAPPPELLHLNFKLFPFELCFE